MKSSKMMVRRRDQGEENAIAEETPYWMNQLDHWRDEEEDDVTTKPYWYDR